MRRRRRRYRSAIVSCSVTLGRPDTEACTEIPTRHRSLEKERERESERAAKAHEQHSCPEASPRGWLRGEAGEQAFKAFEQRDQRTEYAPSVAALA